MIRFLCVLALSLVLGAAHAADGTTAAPAPLVGLSLIRTGGSTTLEGMLYSGGSWTTKAHVNFTAFLIKHGDDLLLYDTGLGSRVEQQYQQDMPHWARPSFKYEEPIVPARGQLDRAGVATPHNVILSHSHWDHASGLGDFPDADIWVSRQELDDIQHGPQTFGGNWPSQIKLPGIKWKTLAFKPVPFEGFAASLDWYGDGSVVVVPLFGHTPGSVGVFVKVDSGRRYFLVGDAVWSAGALKDARPKFWGARWLVDADTSAAQQVVEQLHTVAARDPQLTVLPAHDGALQQSLGYFPAWVK